MPITQDRMLKLIRSGQDYQQALEAVTDIISANRQRVAKGELSAESALDFLSQFVKPDLLLQEPVESKLNLLAEYRHYRLNKHKNDKRKLAKQKSKFQTSNMTESNLPERFEWEDRKEKEWESLPVDDESDSIPNDEEIF